MRSPNVSVTLLCPLCDKPYSFTGEPVSICQHCAHEVCKDPDENAPRIEPSRNKAIAAAVLLVAGFVALPWAVASSIIGVAMMLAGIGLAATLNYRCGNCGASLRGKRDWLCRTCGAQLDFTVR